MSTETLIKCSDVQVENGPDKWPCVDDGVGEYYGLDLYIDWRTDTSMWNAAEIALKRLKEQEHGHQ